MTAAGDNLSRASKACFARYDPRPIPEIVMVDIYLNTNDGPALIYEDLDEEIICSQSALIARLWTDTPYICMRTGVLRRKIIIPLSSTCLPSPRGYYDAIDEISRAGANIKASIEVSRDLDIAIDMWHALLVLEVRLSLIPLNTFISRAAVAEPMSASALHRLESVDHESYGILRQAVVRVATRLSRAPVEVEKEYRKAVKDNHILTQVLAIDLGTSESQNKREGRKKRRNGKREQHKGPHHPEALQEDATEEIEPEGWSEINCNNIHRSEEKDDEGHQVVPVPLGSHVHGSQEDCVLRK